MTSTIIEILVCLVAGLGAGVGTGLAGLSAAAVISPMLITFLHFNSYEAVGIALASDVLASAVSAYTYGKHKNLDIRNGLVILVSVLVFTMMGSYVASLVPTTTMGNFSVLMTSFLGLRFIIMPVTDTRNLFAAKKTWLRILEAVCCGSVIGLICGFVGAGGGMMMLFILTTVLGYELKTAVGTSVFIMTFTAFTGAVSHFSIMGSMPDIPVLIMCIIFTFIGAQISARYANKAPTRTLNRVTGAVLVTLGVIMAVFKFFG